MIRNIPALRCEEERQVAIEHFLEAISEGVLFAKAGCGDRCRESQRGPIYIMAEAVEYGQVRKVQAQNLNKRKYHAKYLRDI